jgi:hypothetical protein
MKFTASVSRLIDGDVLYRPDPGPGPIPEPDPPEPAPQPFPIPPIPPEPPVSTSLSSRKQAAEKDPYASLPHNRLPATYYKYASARRFFARLASGSF